MDMTMTSPFEIQNFGQNTKRSFQEWLIEYEVEPADQQRFNHLLDETLRVLNSDYDAKRAFDLNLKAPVVRNMPRGTFYEWLRVKGKLGGQHKVPRLCNDRRYVEEVLNLYVPGT